MKQPETYLPDATYFALVAALLAAHDDMDPENSIRVALAEIGDIMPDMCREEVEVSTAA